MLLFRWVRLDAEDDDSSSLGLVLGLGSPKTKPLNFQGDFILKTKKENIRWVR